MHVPPMNGRSLGSVNVITEVVIWKPKLTIVKAHFSSSNYAIVGHISLPFRIMPLLSDCGRFESVIGK